MRFVVVIVVVGACGPSPRSTPDAILADAAIDQDLVTPVDRRNPTSVLVRDSRAVWSRSAESCPLESGDECPHAGPSIVMAELGGTATALMTTRYGVPVLAGDPDELFYVTNEAVGQASVVRLRPGTAPVSMSGSHAEVSGSVASASHVYWVEAGINGAGLLLRRAERDGDGSDAMTIASGVSRPAAMFVTDAHVWWLSESSLYRAPTTGGAVELVATNTAGVAAADASSVYIAERTSPTTYDTRVRAVQDDGTSRVVVELLATLLPWHAVVDGQALYWSTNTSVYAVPVVGGEPALVADVPWSQPQRLFGLGPDEILFDFTATGYQAVPR